MTSAGILEAAYNAATGVTAEFNRNLLHVLNRELDADIPVDAFEHVAFYDQRQARIEMHLRARRPGTARFPPLALAVGFAAGELLHTEISCKFTWPQVERELQAAGLRLESWEDPERRFALALSRLPPE